jgi:hypothetical protein
MTLEARGELLCFGDSSEDRRFCLGIDFLRFISGLGFLGVDYRRSGDSFLYGRACFI